MDLSTSETKEGKCPKCGESVKYIHKTDARFWPDIQRPCKCNCGWWGTEWHTTKFFEMETPSEEEKANQ